MASDNSQELSRIQKKIDQLSAVIAFDAGLPVGQTNGGTLSVEPSLEQWVESQSSSQGTVYITGGEDGSVSSEEYDSVSVGDNGWVSCWNDDDDSSTVRYPPHRVLRIEQ